MADVHYRLLDSRRWDLPGSYIVSNGVADQTGLYVIISPEVINTLGGTPTSTINAATVYSSALVQSTFDPAQPASDFTAANWVARGWTDPAADVEAWKLQIRTWILNNLDNSTINACLDPFDFYLLNTTFSGTQYLVPIVYVGDDGEILPVVPEVVVTNYSSLALDQFGNMYGWGENNGILGPVTTSSVGPFYINPSKYVLQNSNALFVDDANSYTWAWGANSSGKLGANIVTALTASSPVSVLSGKKFMKIFAGQGCTLALDDYSYAWAWGPNLGGALGNNSTSTCESSPVSVVGGKQWIWLAAQLTNNTYGLDLNSYAWAWGSNNSGQLGDNTTTSTSSPVSVFGDKQWLIILSHSAAAIALDASSYAWAWGLNSSGQLGIGSTTARSSPVSVLFGQVIAIVTRPEAPVTVVLDPNSYAWAWGGGTLGQLGANITTNRSSPVSVVGDRQWIGVYGFGALDSNSYAWAWGFNNGGQVGDNTTLNRSSPVSVVGGRQWKSVLSLNGGAIGESGGNYYIWGTNAYQTCDLQTSTTSSPILWTGQQRTPSGLTSSPVSIVTGQKFIDFASSGYDYVSTQNGLPTSYQIGHVVALDQSSYAWAWGGNNLGQLGDNTTAWRSSPASVVGGRQFSRVRVSTSNFGSSRHSVGIDSLGYAWAWGANSSGILGDNTGTSKSSPVSVVGGRRFRTIVAGSTVTAALDLNSYAWAWGQNDSTNCRVGDNTTIARSSPVSVVGGRQFKTIEASGQVVALDADGYAWAWGSNAGGALGDNTTIARSSPVSVVGGLRFRAISLTVTATLALDINSYAWAWGSNGYGVLGTNNAQSQSSPVSVAGGRQYDTIQAMHTAVVATKYKDTYVWGQNASGALGLGDTNDRSSPTLAPYIKNVYGR